MSAMSGGGWRYVGEGMMSRSLSLVMDAADVVEHGELRASKSELESNAKLNIFWTLKSAFNISENNILAKRCNSNYCISS